jgi:glycosyltransferase involved in cell wall biosynthesis
VHVLQVVHGFPPAQRAGGEIYAEALAQGLRERGQKVSVFHRAADPALPEYDVWRGDVGGLPVIRVNNTFRECASFEGTYRNEAMEAVFARALEELRPDVVHFHHLTTLSTGLVAQARSRGIRTVFTLHDYWLICQRGQFLKRDLGVCAGQDDGACVRCLGGQLALRGAPALAAAALKATLPAAGRVGFGLRRVGRTLRDVYARIFFRAQGHAREQVHRRMDAVRDACAAVDVFLAPSRFLREKYLAFGIPAERLLPWPYGVRRPAAAPRRARDGGVRFGYLGTWIPPKGLHLLIEAFEGLGSPDVSLHVHGHAVPYPEHEDYVERLRGLVRTPRVHFEGAYDNAAVGERLAGLDVLVVPSIWYENAPLTLQEARLAGVPVIASDLGGMRELVSDGVDGLLFRPRDVSDLREKMARFVRDPALCERLRPSAASVREHGDDVEAHLRLYRDLAGRRAAS